MPVDSVLLPRMIVATAAALGADAVSLARESGLPSWLLAQDEDAARVASGHYVRLWELAEHLMDTPDVALISAENYRLGGLGHYDYLFSSAPTLGDGLAACGPYMGVLTNNFEFTVEAETETEVTFGVGMLEGDGRGRELAMQFALSAVFTRARITSGRPVAPVRVGFAQAAPENTAIFHETFGTRLVDFGAPKDTLTVNKADLAIAHPGGDPALASILRRYAAVLTPPEPQLTTWRERVRYEIGQALSDGDASLDVVSRRLATSPRTLQRRLTEEGTTWRREVDLARQARAGDRASPELARRLGYSDARALRRAMRRWDSADALVSPAADGEETGAAESFGVNQG